MLGLATVEDLQAISDRITVIEGKFIELVNELNSKLKPVEEKKK